ncbi:MAG: hypothetical protein IK127_02060 [Clostridia bacterium]|nr:hypothetical protein [Clostridia bacterium]
MKEKILGYLQLEAESKLKEQLRHLFSAIAGRSATHEYQNENEWTIEYEDGGSFHSDYHYIKHAIKLLKSKPKERDSYKPDFTWKSYQDAPAEYLKDYDWELIEIRESKVPFSDAELQEYIIRINSSSDHLKVPLWIVLEYESGIS